MALIMAGDLVRALKQSVTGYGKANTNLLPKVCRQTAHCYLWFLCLLQMKPLQHIVGQLETCHVVVISKAQLQNFNIIT